MNVGGVKVTPKEKLALNIITYIGCGISLLAITIMLVTFAIFRLVFVSFCYFSSGAFNRVK